MNKLTQAQEKDFNIIKEGFLMMNKNLLFDIKSAVKTGTKYKKELEALKKSNLAIQKAVEIKCHEDFLLISAFFGKYKDIVTKEEHTDSYQIIIGKDVDRDLAIYIDYNFREDNWYDAGLNVLINDEDYEMYCNPPMKVWNNNIGVTNEYNTIEEMFQNVDYSTLSEQLLIKYITNEQQ
jgi:hypothetical protein